MTIDVEALDKQWFYDGLPRDADDEMYALADAIFLNVIAEYARLVPAEDEGRLREALRPWLHHTDACAQRGYSPTCTCGLDDALARLVPAEDEGRLREAWRAGYIAAASQFTTWSEEAIEMEAKRQLARLVPAEDEREVIEVEGAEGVVHRVWKPAEDEDGPEVEWNSAAQRFVPAEDEGRMREALARASNRLDLYQTHDENCPSPAMGSQCPCSHGRLMAECDRALAATPEPR